MYKTMEECRLELVAHTSLANEDAPAGAMDYMPCSAARVSFGREDKTMQDPAKDRKLMQFLADHQHMTPFEYQHATFLIECPLFIRSQIHRHRAFSFNEISRRYTEDDIRFWRPDKWRGQSESNRQASDGLIEEQDKADYILFRNAADSLGQYDALLKLGVAREQARGVLPQTLLTKFYMGGNLRSWAHFIELRREEHAQDEVKVIARRITERLATLWPESCHALGLKELGSV